MRDFNKTDKEIIKRLVSVEHGSFVTLDAFLEEFYFTEQSGRALIVQALGRYAVFFMRTDMFDDAAQKKEELENFLNVISLISYLKYHGYISLFRSEKAKEESMFFIQNGFSSAEPSKGTIILNEQGDFTSSPDTIHNKDGAVIYKGVVYRNDSFEMLLSSTTGTLIIHTELKKLSEEHNKEEVMTDDVVHSNQHENVEATDVPIHDVKEKDKKNESTGNDDLFNRLKEEQEHLKEERLLSKDEVQDKPKQPVPTIEKKDVLGSRAKRSRTAFYNLISVTSFILLLLFIPWCYFKFSKYDDEVTLWNTSKNEKNTFVYKGVKSRSVDTGEKAATKSYYYGIDISKWNGNEVSLLQKEDSITFIIVKATEGLHNVDRMFRKNWATIRSHKFILGAYHFYLTKDDPIRQAQHFWSTVSALGELDITPIVDIEEASLGRVGRRAVSSIQRDLLAYLNYLEEISGRVPMIYTGETFANRYLSSSKFSKYPLWLAEYTKRKKPKIPTAWREKGYKIWQKSDSYYIDSRATDYDIYYGTLSDLVK